MMEIREHTSGLVPGPGLYRMAARVYHADPAPEPSLSASISKLIVAKSMAHARFDHPRLNAAWSPRVADRKMEIGSVSHELLLGRGGGFRVIDAKDYKTKAAQEAKAQAIADGLVPILPADLEAATGIAFTVAATLAHSEDGPFFTEGASEIVAIWQEENGVWCRAMMDKLWLTEFEAIIFDLKTTSTGATPETAGRLMADMSYEIPRAFYERGIAKLIPDLAGRIRFKFVIAETEEPFECFIAELDGTGVEIGRRKVAYAMHRWGEAMENDRWPGYPKHTTRAEYPPYKAAAWMARELNDEAMLTVPFGDAPMPSVEDAAKIHAAILSPYS